MIAELVRPSLLEFIKKGMPGLDTKGSSVSTIWAISGRTTSKRFWRTRSVNFPRSTRKSSKAWNSTRFFPATSRSNLKKTDFGERLSDQSLSSVGAGNSSLLLALFSSCGSPCNVRFLATRAFDPYPFILLNLILSCLAAVQAPVIMMSQNRAEARDRLRAENDYKVNLKAELEIRHLHEKIDHLLRRQYNRLFEIQQIQIELLEEIGRKRKADCSSSRS